MSSEAVRNLTDIVTMLEITVFYRTRRVQNIFEALFRLRNVTKKPVFRIRDILRRIRNLGSVHWITDSDLDPDPALEAQKLTDPDPEHGKKN
jgi:hypothetical protein